MECQFDCNSVLHGLLTKLRRSHIKYTCKTFSKVSSLLRLCTHYQVGHLRQDLLRGLSATWPTTLQGWDAREADATNLAGLYEPREKYPHPMLAPLPCCLNHR